MLQSQTLLDFSRLNVCSCIRNRCQKAEHKCPAEISQSDLAPLLLDTRGLLTKRKQIEQARNLRWYFYQPETTMKTRKKQTKQKRKEGQYRTYLNRKPGSQIFYRMAKTVVVVLLTRTKRRILVNKGHVARQVANQKAQIALSCQHI